MCEPIVIHGGQAGPIRFAGTGLTVAEHQRRTVTNYAQLRDLAPDLPFVPSSKAGNLTTTCTASTSTSSLPALI